MTRNKIASILWQIQCFIFNGSCINLVDLPQLGKKANINKEVFSFFIFLKIQWHRENQEERVLNKEQWDFFFFFFNWPVIRVWKARCKHMAARLHAAFKCGGGKELIGHAVNRAGVTERVCVCVCAALSSSLSPNILIFLNVKAM